jgi:hypothetical protein
MSTKKKSTIPRPFGQPNYLKKETKKAAEPKSRYNNGAKVFIICFAFAGPGLILEAEVKQVDSNKYPTLSENGKIVANVTRFSYIVNTCKGEFEVNESEAHPTFQVAANSFAKGFLYLLK